MKSLYYGRQYNHKTLKRTIPDLHYIPSNYINSHLNLTKCWESFGANLLKFTQISKKKNQP